MFRSSVIDATNNKATMYKGFDNIISSFLNLWLIYTSMAGWTACVIADIYSAWFWASSHLTQGLPWSHVPRFYEVYLITPLTPLKTRFCNLFSQLSSTWPYHHKPQWRITSTIYLMPTQALSFYASFLPNYHQSDQMQATALQQWKQIPS